MKFNIKPTVYVALLTGAFMFFACEKSDVTNEVKTSNENSTLKASGLTEAEKHMLIYMKEEEKLARDVYYAMHDKWKHRVFKNISRAEENHVAAVLNLIKRYKLGSTDIGAPGEFENEIFTNLYQQLVAQGNQSIQEAMKVGALIEELDIKDLQDELKLTDNTTITRVFNNLLNGSKNHLRAFDRQLKRMGVVYVPIYITQEEYDSIINGN
ncbi:MAG: DUF2202 domain-containing protein [Bacteroidales bacterium]|nr:DUF2202 domain-containing protein [Bacteroidales bacterium]